MDGSSDGDGRPLLERIRAGRRHPPRLLDADAARGVAEASPDDAVAVVMALGIGAATIDDVYAFAVTHPVADYADELAAPGRFDPAVAARLCPNVRWLRRTARDAEPVKLAIVLTGAVGDERDVDDLVVLAADEEFTLLAATAIERLTSDPTDAWLAVARAASGWGLVEIVERLSTRSVPRLADRQRLIALAGKHGDVIEQLAAPAATAGRFVTTVAPAAPDDVLDGAATIIATIARGGFDGDAKELAEAYVTAVAGRCDRLVRLDALSAVLTIGGVAAVMAADLLAAPQVASAVRQAFATGDPTDRALALRLAPAVGIDLWDEACAALRADPQDATLAFTMLQEPSAIHVQAALDLLAEQPAARLADHVLDEALRRIAAGDVACDRLVGAGLLSANPRIRELAARATGSIRQS